MLGKHKQNKQTTTLIPFKSLYREQKTKIERYIGNVLLCTLLSNYDCNNSNNYNFRLITVEIKQ